MPVKLIAAPHTPFHPTGELNLPVIEQQAGHLRAANVSGVFICGSTGEGVSLTVEERMAMATKWVEAAKPHGLQVIVQVGSNCQADAVRLAAHAAEIGVDAVSSLAPSYFKPAAVDDLIGFFEPIAEAAARLPFYFYDIPALTGVSLSTIEFLRRSAGRLPNLAGVKYTNSDLIQFQECVRFEDGRFEIWFGCDEALLAGYALGARGAVGSTYNFAAPLYHRMIAARDAGDEDNARLLQAKSIELIRICQDYGFSAAAKCVMEFLGIDCGGVRSPLRNLTAEQKTELAGRLGKLKILAMTTPN